MNEVFKNTHAFMEVLKMARSEAVQHWDEAALQRAFKWARYFEEVHCKLKTKPTLAEKLDQYLLNFRKSSCVYLGHLCLSFEMLQNSKDILRLSLLQNPHLSQKLSEAVLQLYGNQIRAVEANMEPLFRDLVTLEQSKAATHLMSRMADCLRMDLISGTSEGAACGEWHFESREVGVCASAQCLRQYLQHHLRYGDKENMAKLQQRLAELASQECGLHTLVSLLFQSPHEHTDAHVDEVAQFVLKCLAEYISHSGHEVLPGLPPRLLSRASSVYVSFFKVYLSDLISWGNNMEPVVVIRGGKTVSIWRHTQKSDDESLSFDSLASHVEALLSGPGYLAEIATKAFNSLTTNTEAPHGGRDQSILEGGNIWKDILALNAR